MAAARRNQHPIEATPPELKRPILIAVPTMLAQQALATMAGLSIPVLAPAISGELGLDAGLIGAYTVCIYGAAMAAALGGGGFILRYGGLRVSQICLLLLGVGLLASSRGELILFALGAIVMGLGTGPSTPASSHLLIRYAAPKTAPLVFSIKQTGVPLGGAMAGALVPLFAVWFGWRGALAAGAILCLALMLAVQPFRGELDSDRQSGRSLTWRDLRHTLGHIATSPGLRRLSLVIFVFTGIQLVFGSFFVLYLVQDIGLPLATAGLIYALAQGAAIPGRILWGWIASRHGDARVLLAGLGLTIAGTTALLALMDGTWPLWALWAASVLFGLTGISYQGLLLAEIARISPPGMAGVITGGTVCFAYAGMMILPAAFGAILSISGSYEMGFWLATIPALCAGGLLLKHARDR